MVPSVPFLFLVLLFVNIGIAEAFPFSKASGVVELTSATFNQFVSSHKPVYVLFYAPWCGHCRKIHPEWEKFAKAVQGTIRVGALNADEHKQLSQQFGIRGFPTIKYWTAGEKKINKPRDYEGPRDAGSIQANAMGLIPLSNVKTILNVDALRDAALQAPEKKVVVLFSSKTRVPAIFSVLSLSPRLKLMPFYFVGGKAKKGVAEEFGVKQLPAIVVLNATDGDIKTVLYKGKQIAYEPIAKFLLSCAENVLSELDEIRGSDGEVAKENEKKDEKSASKLAIPVRPVRLTAHLLTNFCLPTTLRSGEQPPLCVVSLTSSFSLDSVHMAFRNEPVLFFEAHADHDVLVTFLRKELGLTEVADVVKNNGDHQVLLLRASKLQTIRYKVLDGIETASALDEALQKVLAGELQLLKKKVEMSG